MSEGLAQGPCVATRVRFEPATFWTQGTEPTTEPPHLIIVTSLSLLCNSMLALLHLYFLHALFFAYNYGFVMMTTLSLFNIILTLFFFFTLSLFFFLFFA